MSEETSASPVGRDRSWPLGAKIVQGVLITTTSAFALFAPPELKLAACGTGTVVGLWIVYNFLSHPPKEI